MHLNFKPKISFLWMLLFMSVFQKAQAQTEDSTKYSFTVNEAIAYALTHQNAVLNASIDEKIAQQKVKETLGSGLPQISGSLSIQDYLTLPTTLLPGEFMNKPGQFIPVKFGVKYQSTAGIDVSQMIFDGSYLVGLKASKSYKELSIINTQRTKIETAVAVTKAYYGVLVNNEKLTLLLANIEQLKSSLFQTEQSNINGFAEKVDVDRLKVMSNNLNTEKENLIQLLALNLNLLKFQMGMPIESPLALKDKIESITWDADKEINSSNIEGKRVEFSILEAQKKLNELDLKRYKSQFLPSLSAFGNFQKNFQNNSFSDLYNNIYPSNLIGLKLAIPIYSGGQKRARINQSKLAIQKNENDLQQMKNSLNYEVQAASVTYKTSINSLNTQKENLELANEVLKVAKIKYEQGVGSSLEVTQAQTSLKETENNYINALYNITINKVDLDKALGNYHY